ncbi:MAG: serine/threonine protein kinase [Deltaproteobacteria bacterium]|nr:serine/threonine protein kinase [Deltaproteobacteria bacterium]
MDSPGTILAGKYQLVDIAGTGGMATVWRAVQRGPGTFERFVAVKAIREHLVHDATFVAMFVEEARVSAQLQHPNVVQVHDFVEDGARQLLVMEWVDGLSLSQLLKQFAEQGLSVPWTFVALVGLEALRGLTAAHEHRDPYGRPMPVFHRDVTPQNILVGSNGQVKLSDFGLARASDRARMTAPDIVKGKVGYLAPELTLSPEPTPQTDLYALGVVLWQAFAGRKLFEGKDDVEIFLAARRGEIPPLAEVRHELPDEVAKVIERALAFDPSDRYESAHQMSRILARALRAVDVEQDSRVVAEPLLELRARSAPHGWTTG